MSDDYERGFRDACEGFTMALWKLLTPEQLEWLHLQLARGAQQHTHPHYTCPFCAAVSYNPHDLEHRYCGRCHRFADGGSYA